MLNFAMPLYEAKYHDEDEWIEISDLEIMDELYKTYTKVTPAIKEMIRGKQVETPHGIYRLKLKGGEQANYPQLENSEYDQISNTYRYDSFWINSFR